jgi:hypothetical protein
MGHFSWTKSFLRRSFLKRPTCFICIKYYVGLGFENNPFKIRGKALYKILCTNCFQTTFCNANL